MPLARIDMSKDTPPERIKLVSEVIYSEIANAPLHDKFQVATRHAADEIIYPNEGCLGLTFIDDLIVIQVTWVGGRSADVRKKYYMRIADEIHERTGIRNEDIWINLVDDARKKPVVRQRRDAIRAKMRLPNVSGEEWPIGRIIVAHQIGRRRVPGKTCSGY